MHIIHLIRNWHMDVARSAVNALGTDRLRHEAKFYAFNV
jgi:hypothetical protein